MSLLRRQIDNNNLFSRIRKTTPAFLSIILTLSSLSSLGSDGKRCLEFFQSVRISTTYRLHEEIYKIPEGGALSKSMIQKSTPEEIGYNLARRLDKNNQRIKALGKTGFNPLKDSDLMMFFREENFTSISEKGFLNYHQVGFTRGDSTLGNRALHEDYILRLSIEAKGYDSFIREKLMDLYNKGQMDKKPIVLREARLKSPYNRIRAKYSYMVIRDLEMDIGDIVFRNQYGNYAALLKEEVKFRSTWTPTDSLAASPKDIFTFQDERVDIKAYSSQDIKYYFEAQIWGDVALKDVQAWLVPERANLKSDIIKAMKKTKIPIKLYRIQESVHPDTGSITNRPIIVGEIAY